MPRILITGATGFVGTALSKYLSENNKLNKNTVVSTVMSNLGLQTFSENNNLNLKKFQTKPHLRNRNGHISFILVSVRYSAMQKTMVYLLP